MALCLMFGGLLPAKAQHYVPLDGTVSSHLSLPKLGQDSVYLVSNALTVVAGGSLEMSPGVEILFESSAFLRVDGGFLSVVGTADEPVCFRPFELARDWSGIQLKNIDECLGTCIVYVEVHGALTALTASNCSGVSVKHCGFYNSYAGKGLDLTDCDAFVVDSCVFSQCVNGIELKSKARDCVRNVFSHNVFDKGQINMAISNTAFGFKCRDNVISDNCFQNALTALYFERLAGVMEDSGKNYVVNNVISSGLPDGNVGYSSYGIRAGMDSLVIKNNVFWKNDEAINVINNCHLIVSGNTFQQNGQVLTNVYPNTSADFSHNVFSATDDLILEFSSADNKVNGNNVVNNNADAVWFANRCPSAIDMRQNYWQCFSPETIEPHIFDGTDNPELGEIIFEPFLTDCDTLTPISPPGMVKKQYINGKWKISWDDNPESDFSHYILYYGDFDCYKFKFQEGPIMGNSYILPSHLAENVAVAACDRHGNFEAFAPAGRSAYAFAEYYPYAGEDASLCAPTTGFQISNANIPYSYNNSVWRSSGSGTFSDPLSLRTTYFPSDEDFDAGEVTLTLRVVSGEMTRSSSLVLRLFDQLTVDAGTDYYSDMLHPILLENAQAEHYDSLYWVTCGDGHFVDARELNALYYPGEREKEARRVKLALNAWSYCGHVADTVVYELYDEFSLEGKTWFRGALCPNTQVLAVAQGDAYNFATGFYRTVSDEQGVFSFGALLPDTYILYALPDTLDFEMAGAYYLGDLQWNESNMIVVNGNVYDVDVALPEVLPMAFGDGTVSGWFEMPETVFKAKDFYCQSWLHADSVEYCTEGLSNVSVVLLNATRQRILGFTLTDSRGRFSFRHLPYGTYYLMADLPRYGRGFCAPVTLSVAHPDERDLRLFVNGQGRVAMACQGENLDETGVQLYPNPANDALVVNGLAVNEYYSILIMNSLGDIVKNEVSYPRADGSVVIGVGALPCGVYFLQLESASARVVTKFVK